MLRVLDAGKLALTKLRTRKIRLAATIVIAGLLFAIIVFGLTVLHASADSAERFGRGTMATRYLMSYSNYNANLNKVRFEATQDVKNRVLALHQKRVAEKQAAAKALGVEYDANTEAAPIIKEFPEDPGSLNLNSWAVNEFLKQYNTETNPLTPAKTGAAARRLGAIKAYPVQSLEGQDGGTLAFMVSGRESFRDDEEAPEQVRGLADAINQQTIADESLLRYYFLDNRQRDLGDEIPVFVSYDDAAALLGKKPLPADSTPEQHLQRMQDLRREAAGITMQVCYRNAASSELIQQAARQQRASANKTKDSTDAKPSVEYALPSADSCGAAAITKDNRSKSEKAASEKLQQFNQQFSTENLTPQQAKLTYRVVGLLPSKNLQTTELKDFFANMLSANLPERWVIPKQTFEASAAAKKYLPGVLSTENTRTNALLSGAVIYEFASADQARNFDCATRCEGSSKDKDLCADGISNFVMPFGSNSIVLDEVLQQIAPIIWYALLGVVGVAAFILMLTISRTIADSRKESAVFRALGATRLDIAQIYLTYTLLLAGLIALFAIFAGLIAAAVVNNAFSADLSVTARYVISPRDLSLEFKLFALNLPALALTVASIIAAALLASLVPLLRNTRRNPIKDMRDE